MDKDIKMEEFKKAKLYSPLVLAYIGDSIYEVYVRSRIIRENPDLPAHKLHKEAIRFVKAHAQSVSIENIIPMLTEEEDAVYRRGRNAKSPTVPKNADVTEYRRATGFEALIGFLYMDSQTERLEILMEKAYDAIKNEKE